MGTIKHVYNQTVADGTATSVVRPSDWNSAHNYTMQDAVSLSGNTSGALANISSGTFYLAGGNNVTLSQNANSVTVSALASSSLVGTYGVGLSTNGSTVSVSMPYMPSFEPYPLLQAVSTTFAPAAGSWYFMPVYVEQPMSGGRVNVMVAHGSTASILRESSANFASGTTGTVSYNFSYQRIAALYGLGTGTNSTRLESTWSNDFSLSIGYSVKVATGGATTVSASAGGTMTYIASINSAGARTTSSVSHSGSSSSASSAMATSALTSILSSERNMLSSQLMLPIAFNTTIGPGLYWMAFMWTTNSTTATTGGATTNQVLSVVNQYAIFGNTNTAARVWGQTVATSGSQVWPGHGVFTAASAAPPSTVAFSDVRTQASQPIIYWNLVNSAI